MGQQIRKVTKRRRRVEYIKRKKEQSKLNSNTPIRLAVPVAKDAKPAAKEAPAKKTAAKAPAKKTETKAAAAKKAPAKKPAAKKAAEPPPNNCPGGGFPPCINQTVLQAAVRLHGGFLHVRASCIFPEREEVARLSR
ncbi:MAG: hypothetical protein ACLT38_03270 [Akkermansia sp.]